MREKIEYIDAFRVGMIDALIDIYHPGGYRYIHQYFHKQAFDYQRGYNIVKYRYKLAGRHATLDQLLFDA